MPFRPDRPSVDSPSALTDRPPPSAPRGAAPEPILATTYAGDYSAFATPEPDPTVPRTGEILTRDNYRPGITFRHVGSSISLRDTVHVTATSTADMEADNARFRSVDSLLWLLGPPYLVIVSAPADEPEPDPDPTEPRVGDVLTRENYRPGISFRYLSASRVHTATSPAPVQSAHSETCIFVCGEGHTWYLGTDDLSIVALPDPTEPRVGDHLTAENYRPGLVFEYEHREPGEPVTNVTASPALYQTAGGACAFTDTDGRPWHLGYSDLVIVALPGTHTDPVPDPTVPLVGGRLTTENYRPGITFGFASRPPHAPGTYVTESYEPYPYHGDHAFDSGDGRRWYLDSSDLRIEALPEDDASDEDARPGVMFRVWDDPSGSFVYDCLDRATPDAPEPDPTEPRVGDYLTRDNYRPGIAFQHVHRGSLEPETHVAVSPEPRLSIPPDICVFDDISGQTWLLGTPDLRIVALTDPSVPRVGDQLTRANYRPGVVFRHEGRGLHDPETHVTASPEPRLSLPPDVYSFASEEGQNWYLGTNDLCIMALPGTHTDPVPDPTVPRAGDYLTRDNYRPGIVFQHTYSHHGPAVETHVTGSTSLLNTCSIDIDGQYRSSWVFDSTDGRTWTITTTPNLRIAALPEMAPDVLPDEPRHVTTHRATTVDEQDRALALREQGLTWDQVADRMGWPRTTPERYSVARWAGYMARQRRGDYFSPPSGHPYQPRVGIEIEFNRASGADDDYYNDDCTAGRVLDYAHDARLDIASEEWNHDVPTRWTMRPDCTVTGGEFISPPLPATDEGYDEIATALQAVRDAGGRPGRNQGMHVHHDVTDLRTPVIRRLVDTLRAWQGAIMAAVPESRYDGSNEWGAALVDSDEWSVLRDMAAGGRFRWTGHGGRRGTLDRYRSFNFDATLAYGTVEFRGLGNTLNTTKIITWARVTGAVVQHARAGLPVPSLGEGTETMLATLLAAELIDELTARRFRGMADEGRRTCVRAHLAACDPEAVPIAA